MTTLRVGAAFPDPPFNDVQGGGAPVGLDIELMNALAAALGTHAEFVKYSGSDFNGIFDALAAGEFDCVTSGTTITPGRRQQALFCAPYLISGQSMAVDVTRLPQVHTTDDLTGLTIGVQQGNTSQPIADKLVADGKAARVRVYDYSSIRDALNDLTTGGCDVFMKLAPVLTSLVRPVPGVEVVQRGISREEIAVAVPLHADELWQRINAAQAAMEADGRLDAIRTTWLGSKGLDQSGAA